jgi:hypothetical protein
MHCILLKIDVPQTRFHSCSDDERTNSLRLSVITADGVYRSLFTAVRLDTFQNDEDFGIFESQLVIIALGQIPDCTTCKMSYLGRCLAMCVQNLDHGLDNR